MDRLYLLTERESCGSCVPQSRAAKDSKINLDARFWNAPKDLRGPLLHRSLLWCKTPRKIAAEDS
jgi:hypothetical protein